MFLTTHLSPIVMIGLTIASGVIFNPSILHECIALRSNKINNVCKFVYAPTKYNII